MGDHIRVPKEHMVALGTSLIEVKGRLEAELRDGGLVQGLEKYGNRDGAIGSAESSFQDAWETSIEKMLDAIGNLGEISKAIGDGATKIDDSVKQQADSVTSQLAQLNTHKE